MTGETRSFRFVGEHLALDFVNTRTVEREGVVEALPTFASALAWFRAAEILSATAERSLLRHSDPGERADALRRLLAFRALVRDLLDERHRHGTLAPRHVAAINAVLAGSSGRREMIDGADGCELRVRYAFERPIDLLAPLAEAVADLLANEDATRIKRCGSDCCDMYFLDTSRNRSRTWCDMAVCGNRAKAANYYRRTSALR